MSSTPSSVAPKGSPTEGYKLHRLGGPLSAIFWGLVFVVFDPFIGLGIGSRGARIDLLPDFIGLAILTMASWRLASSEAFKGMADVLVTIFATVATALCLGSIAVLLKPELGLLMLEARSAFAGVEAIAFAGFCAAMCQLAKDVDRRELIPAWATTAVLFALFYPGPTLAVILKPELASNLAFHLAAWVLGAIPLGLFLWATRKTKGAFERAYGKVPGVRGAV